MNCWHCGTIIVSRESEVNFCHICGMQLRQKCPYCDKMIDCMSKECEFCGNMFSHCNVCHLSLKLEQTKCDICHTSTIQIRDIFNHNTGNTYRTNCIEITEEEYCELQETLQRKTEISPIVICNKNIIFWEKIQTKNNLVCYNVANNKNRWESNKDDLVAFNIKNIEYIEICGFYVMTHTKGKLIINSMSSGKHIATIKILGDYKATILNKRLYVLKNTQENNQTQTLEIYDHPFTVPGSNISIEFTEQRHNTQTFPIDDGKTAFIPDFTGKIIKFDPESLKYEVIYQCENNTTLGYMAISDNVLLFTIKCADDTCSVYRFDLSSNNKPILITNKVSCYLDKFSVYKGNIYISGNNEHGQLSFFSYPIRGSSSGYNDMLLANTSHISDFYALIIENVPHIVYKCSDIHNKFLEIRELNFKTKEIKSFKKVSKTASSCIVTMYNNIVIAELDSGVIQIGRIKK